MRAHEKFDQISQLLADEEHYIYLQKWQGRARARIHIMGSSVLTDETLSDVCSRVFVLCVKVLYREIG